ncbi:MULTISPECIES: hypothetical protein [Gracilibacillus]|uniref:hypothetical protein n=1 Tax=Gracilibacillus TaxID=74385 RepID=UPI000824B7B5|nr:MULTISPECIES: hypothetical protein [Gracilibacillus]
MKLIVNEKNIDTKEITTATQMVEKIQTLADDDIINQVTINAQDVYDDFEAYLEQHWQSIEYIKVITQSKKQFINDTLLTAENYLDNAVDLVQELSNNFYQKPGAEDWNQFQYFTEGITWFSNILVTIDSLKERPNNWKCYVDQYHKLEDGIKELAEAVEADDETLIADIIQYEMIPIYQNLKKLISNTIDTEGCRPHAH